MHGPGPPGRPLSGRRIALVSRFPGFGRSDTPSLVGPPHRPVPAIRPGTRGAHATQGTATGEPAENDGKRRRPGRGVRAFADRVDLGRPLSNPGRHATALEALWRKLPDLETPLPPKEPHEAPRRQWRRDEEQIQAIVSGYREGATIRQLAIKHRIGRETVSKILKQQSVKLRNTGLTPEQIDEAVRLYANGWSLARIGHRFSADGKTVWSRLTERGVKMRDAHDRSL